MGAAATIMDEKPGAPSRTSWALSTLGADPAESAWTPGTQRSRHAQPYEWGATAATWIHLRWLARRDRSPWVWIVPLAVVAALLSR